MAYKIKDIYPSQTTTGDAGWPDGKPRNIQGGVQGTGTPFEEKLFQDYEGGRQALFAEAGITPSGVVDKVGASDFVGAMKKVANQGLFGKIFQSPTDGGLTEIQTLTANAGEVYEVRKTSDDSLATIYSDAAGTTEIVQNGTSNVSGSDGVVKFYIAEGDYYVASGVLSSNFIAGILSVDYSIWGDRYAGSFESGFTYNSLSDVARGQDGKYYRYIGTANFPVSVTAGVIPSDSESLYEDVNSLPYENVNGIGAKLKRKLDADLGDANMIVVGDSTGNETTEWVYIFADRLANEYPTYTVKYHLWDVIANNYAAPIDISVGSGFNTLNIYNASVAGADTYYWQGFRFDTVHAVDADLVIQNLGHNGGTSLMYDVIYSGHFGGLYKISERHKKADICVILQNFRTDFEDYSLRAVTAMADIATNLSLQFVDVYSLFKYKQRTGDVSDWLSDSVHPNRIGSIKWANLVFTSFMSDNNNITTGSSGGRGVANPINSDPFMQDFLLDDQKPSGSTLFNCTAEISTEESELGRSIKLTSTGSLGYMRFGLNSLDIENVKASGFITVAFRVFNPTANSSANNGRIFITTSNGTYSTTKSGSGSWTWNTLVLPASVVDGSTFLRMHVYVDGGESIYVSKWFCYTGINAAEPLLKAVILTDYYYPENVQPQSTTDISVNARDVEILATSTGAEYRFFIDVPNLTKNATYRVSFASDITQVATIFAREGLGATGSVVAQASVQDNGIDFVATSSEMSLLVTMSTGNTLPRNITGIEIKVIASAY